MSGSNPTQSGREAARARRQAMKSGKTGTSSTAAARRPAPVASAPVAQAPLAQATAAKPVSRPAVQVATAPIQSASAAGREAAKQKRQQLKSGKVSQPQSSTNPHPKAKANKDRAPLVEMPARKPAAAASRPADSKVAVKTEVKTAESSGRSMARAWRKAGAKGKVGQSAYKSKGTQSGALAKMANPDASTREIARKIRAERCTRGKAGCTVVETASAKKSRQSKASKAAPEKVGESKTLSGQRISGTQVGQGRKVMTGAETGACQLVSGTEYLGTEEFAGNCQTTPNAKPAKVTQTQTTRGQIVSGNEVGRAKSVTGDEAGSCKSVTGTEYLPADQSALFCGADAPKAAAAKGAFSIMSQPSQAKKGSTVTGSDSYKSQSTTIRPSTPAKVVASKTAMGMTTTGTQVGRLENVTGSEKGVCKSVTGTGYQSAEEAQEYCDTPAAPTAIKVTTSSTSRGQVVTGDRSGGFDNRMTGAEAGSCKAVTGTSYMGSEQFAVCSPEQQQAAKNRMRQGINHAVTGVQPGPVGLTGAQKGACTLVSGTHYQGNDQTALVCDSANAAQPGQSDFPQMMGSVMSSRVAVAAAPAPVMEAAPAPATVESPASRITGDGWDRGSKVTGTEGPWAAQRNASIRGAKGQAPMSASQYRPVAMAEVPQSPITGSSGNTNVGAKVTLSGGARA